MKNKKPSNKSVRLEDENLSPKLDTLKKRFKKEVLTPYIDGRQDQIKSDVTAAWALIPPGTAEERSFAFVGEEIPKFIPDQCVACMECVIACPDAAIHSRTLQKDKLGDALSDIQDEHFKEEISHNFVCTIKHGKTFEKKGKKPGLFSIWIDPDKCKGCGECVEACGSHNALEMIAKTEAGLENCRNHFNFISKSLDNSPEYYINDRLNVDMFMDETLRVYCGGAGSCTGCGEVTAINMTLTATAKHHQNNMVLVAATGCNTVYSSAYPYNVFQVPWTNSLFENSTAVAMGVRLRLNQQGKEDTIVWVIGGDGAMWDIGFQSLSRLLTTQMDINVLVIDTQAYSNTGGQASTATFHGQNAKMSAHGSVQPGKMDRRKELGILAMHHPDVFVAQVSPAYINHFLNAVQDAVSYPGPSVVIAYTACMPEHKIPDHAAYEQSKAAVISRAFPLYVFDPRKGDSFTERLSLQGNPAVRKDWVIDEKRDEVYDFVWFAKKEGRFAAQFNKEGKPSETLLQTQKNRLQNWHTLQHLSGIKERS